MVTDSQTYIFDTEFAYYGPMAVDVSKVIANLLLAAFSTPGHELTSGVSREAQRGEGMMRSGAGGTER